jgi:5-methylcytosine-specific restriction protein B
LSNRYVVPPFLRAVLAATAYESSPVFVILMNLAPVEYYFSDVLSAMETKKEPKGGRLQLHSSLIPLEGSTGVPVSESLSLPPNLYIIGTVNVDETTHPISDRVLDRAMLIDMSAVNIDGFLNDLVNRDSDLQAACDACRPVLTAAAATMAEYNTGFGYRIAEEVVRYHAFATARLQLKSEDILDDLLVQKVLVKLRGGERHRPLLTRLTGILLPFPRAIALLGRLTADLDELGSFQVTPQG